jgi:hypothetical protein
MPKEVEETKLARKWGNNGNERKLNRFKYLLKANL